MSSTFEIPAIAAPTGLDDRPFLDADYTIAKSVGPFSKNTTDVDDIKDRLNTLTSETNQKTINDLIEFG